MRSAPTIVWRLALLGAVVASWSHRAVADAGSHPSGRHLWAVLAWTLLIAVGQRLRGAVESRIHDRQADGIIATAFIGMAVVTYLTVTPRLGAESALWWIEIPLAVAFTMGWSVALFGTRPTFRYGRAWSFGLLLGWPITFRIIADLSTGYEVSEFAALVAIAALATALVIGGPARHSALAAALTVVFIIVFSLAPLPASPTRDLAIVVLASLAASLPWFLGWIGHGLVRSPARPLVVRRARLAEGLALVIACVFWAGFWAMEPHSVSTPTLLMSTSDVETSPEGWELLAVLDVPLAATIFGPEASWTRAYWRAEDTNRAAHNRDGVPRRIILDDVRVSEVEQLVFVPFSSQYELSEWSRSPVVSLDSAEHFALTIMGAVLERSTDVSLAATFVSVDIGLVGGTGQRLSAIAVDDHRSTAPFPAPGRGFRSDVRSTIQRLLRGDIATTVDAEGVRDRELLETVIVDLLEGPGGIQSE